MAPVSKLSELCLDSIRKNFNKFIEAYEHSDDVQIKRSLLFLQKKYSSHFLKIFSNEYAPTPYYLEKTYFNFLLNQYLRELNTSIFLEEDWEVALHYLKDIGQSFEEVTFQYRHPPKAVEAGNWSWFGAGWNWFKFGEPDRKRLKISPSCVFLQEFVHVLLPCLTNISSLTFNGPITFTEETVKMICSTCKELKDLTFDGSSRITEEGLKSLCPGDQCNKLNLRSLNFFSIDRNLQPPAICYENGIAHLLRNMPSLEVIGMPSSHLAWILHRMHEGDWLNNSLSNVRKYNLTSMEINVREDFFHDVEWDTERTMAIVAELCPALKKLRVCGVFEKKHLLPVTKFPDLVDVSIISGFDSESVDVDEFLRVSGKQLKVLRLIGCRGSVPLLLTSCPRLESLNLRRFECTVFLDYPNLMPLFSLKDLRLNVYHASYHNTAKSLQLLLKCCPNLQELRLTGYAFEINGEVTGIVVNSCERAECLRSLTFKSCRIWDLGLLQHIVSTCRSLKRLVLIRCATIGMREIEALRNFVKASENSEVSIKFTLSHPLDMLVPEDPRRELLPHHRHPQDRGTAEHRQGQ